MERIVRGALVQATFNESAESPVEKISKAMTDKAVSLLEEAVNQGAQVLCFQELFNGPYFCAEQTVKWYDLTEKIPDGPTTRLMQELAKKHEMALVALMVGIAPNIPGFLNAASNGRIGYEGFLGWLVSLYPYAWFVSLALAAGIYVILMQLFPPEFRAARGFKTGEPANPRGNQPEGPATAERTSS
jgi:hypothetical protein